jgi:uncharacterized protein (DUF58 family)
MRETLQPAEATERLLRRIRALEFRVNRLLDTGLAGAYRSIFRGRGIEAEGLREYTFEDDAALIDWPVTVRVQRPHVRVYREERELVCLLLVDASASMGCLVEGATGRSAAADVAALLALAAVRNRDRVGLLLFSAGGTFWLPPARSREQALRIVREIACHELAGSGTSLSQGLQAAARLLSGRALVFLISDLLTSVPEADLARLSRRHEVIVLRLRYPEPAWASLPALTWLEDAETGACLPIRSGGPFLDAWRQEVACRDGDLRQAVRGCGAEWVDLPCGPEAVTTLAAYLTRRSGDRRRRPALGGLPA